MVKNQINHLMPTTSPAPKHQGTIESVVGAMKLYESKGVDRVVLQPKYMGSYCDIYFKPDHSETQFVSRGGYRITHKDREEMLEASKELHAKVMLMANQPKLIVVASEMMPWNYLGKGLIEREFRDYGIAMAKLWGEYQIDDFIEADRKAEFLTSLALNTRSEHNEEFRPHEHRHLSAISELPSKYQMSVGTMQFQRALNYFGMENPLEFKPFQVLKIEREDGKVIIPDSDTFHWFSQEGRILDVTNHAEAEQYYHQARFTSQEGIVVKPLLRYDNPKIPSSIKVRTPEYLHLIYGNDFNYNYNTYYAKRRIQRKLQTHLKELKVSRQLLEIPQDEITLDNAHYKGLVYAFFKFFETEEQLDNTL